MGARERREKEKEVRRDDIIDTAERVFFSKGFESATMDDISRAAQYSKRTLYLYFRGKEQLYHAIVLRAFRTINAMNDEALRDAGYRNGLEKLRVLGRTFLEFIRRHPDYFHAVTMYGTPDAPCGTRSGDRDDDIECGCLAEADRSFQLLMGTIREGMADGSVRNDIDVVSTAFILHANIIGISAVVNKPGYIRHYSKKAPADLIEEMFRFVGRSLRQPAGA